MSAPLIAATAAAGAFAVGVTYGAVIGRARERLFWLRRCESWLSQVYALARDPNVSPELLAMHLARLRSELASDLPRAERVASKKRFSGPTDLRRTDDPRVQKLLVDNCEFDPHEPPTKR
jgi:hypothetical protein